ncbi:MAG: clan AA aspartic protease [Magnetococcales bacterium]|nr:clan AA aspartic protease [Magnetococcales bacterium]
MRYALWLVCWWWVVSGSPAAWGGGPLVRCVDSEGRSVWRNEPCQGGERDALPGGAVETIPLLTHGVRGQYWVAARLNGALEVAFLIDTGANIVVIPRERIDQLVAAGSIKPEDWMGSTTTRMADGSLVRHPMVRLERLQIGGHVVRNIAVSVTPAKSIPLLGTPVLEQLGAWRIDHALGRLVLPMAARPGEGEPGGGVASGRNTMQQCWRGDGSTYLTPPPCPAGEEALPPATHTATLIARCRALLTWAQAFRPGGGGITEHHLHQYRARVMDYNQQCPGLIHRGDSGQAELLREIVTQPGQGGR